MSLQGILLLCLTALSAIVRGQNKCPAEFLRLSDHHSYCLTPNKQCQMVSANVRDSEKQIILDVHNKLRSKVATGQDNAQGLPTASNMLQMVWDDTLAAIAQTYAYQCIYEHDCIQDGNNDCRSVPDFGVGQNMAESDIPCDSSDCMGASDKAGRTADWPTMIQMFYNEREFVDPSIIESFMMDSSWGHFSQVAWALTWKVGCGYVGYLYGPNQMHGLYVCNYGIAANLPGAPVYEAGAPCSGCPTDSCCGGQCSSGPNYPGLCKLNDPSKAPHWKVDPLFAGKDVIYDCKFDDKCDYNVRNDGWMIYDRAFGRTAEIVLQGGQTATIDFDNPIKPKSEFCLVLMAKKGPNVAGQQKTGKLKFTIKMGSNDPWVVNVGDYSQNSYSCFQEDTTFSLSYTVPQNSPPQYLSVSRIFAYLGSCS